MTKSIKMICLTMLIAAAVCAVPFMRVLGFELPDPARAVSLEMTVKTSGSDVHYADGAEITMYKVADCRILAGSVHFILNSDYAASGLDLDNKITQSMIDDLVTYTADHSISGTTKMTDSNGNVMFDGLASGVYLVSAASLPENFTSFVPFLIYLPFYDGSTGSWVYDTTAEPKISYLPPVTVTVKKVWNDDGKSRPDFVSVRLENEDGIYDTVTLNAANNWRYEWPNLNASKNWSVKEINIPADYKATYSSSGYDFTVTNTAQLIQTGQPNWPVPVLVFAGSFMVCAGLILKNVGKRKDEEQA